MQPKTIELNVQAIDGADFLTFLGKNNRSDAVDGRINSQYANQLRVGDPKHGAEGLVACGQIIGGYSYGITPMPMRPGAVSARLDVVVSNRVLRGLGIGALMMAAFVRNMAATWGPRLGHLSTVAVHPAVEHYMSRFGFEAALTADDTPVLQLSLEDGAHEALLRQASYAQRQQLAGLKNGCLKCVRLHRSSSWCQPQRSAA